MASRAAVNGDTGESAPEHWIGGLASDALHAIVILFARDAAERDRSAENHARYLADCGGVKVLSSLDLEAIPPYEYAHEHFGYRDRLSQPEIEGSGVTPTPGSGGPLKPGEFFLGYEDEMGIVPPLPQPELLSRNGSFVAYRRLEEHVGAFRNFLKRTARRDETTRPIIDGRTRGLCKIVVDRDSRRILGTHVVGERAVEVAQMAAIAMEARMTIDELARIPLSFPTYANVFGRAVVAAVRDVEDDPRRIGETLWPTYASRATP